ncbi:MAG: rod shape-determining protein MreC [Candidatus Parcubacteria bacterium]|jgi:cell shape-determining protein MreC
MTYLQDKKKRQDTFVTYILISVVIILVLLGVQKSQRFFFNFVAQLTTVTDSTVRNITSSITNASLDKKELQKRITALEAELEVYKQKEGSYALQEIELLSLRNALNATSSGFTKTKVSVQSNTSLYGTVLVDTSRLKTVQSGSFLVGDSGSLIGEIVYTGAKNTSVQLLDTISNPIPVFLLNSDITLNARGKSRGVLIAEVARDANIVLGDIVVLSSERDIPIGTVVEFSKDEKNPFKEVYIRMNDTLKNSTNFYILQK